MVNQWVEYVRKWSKDNNMTYMCAVSNPQLRADYYKAYPKTKRSKSKTKETPFIPLEEEFPSTEATPKNITIKKTDKNAVRVKRKTIDGVKYLIQNNNNKLYSEFKTPHYSKNEAVGYWDEKTKTIEPLRDEDYDDEEDSEEEFPSTEATPIKKITITKTGKERKPRATKAEMEQRRANLSGTGTKKNKETGKPIVYKSGLDAIIEHDTKRIEHGIKKMKKRALLEEKDKDDIDWEDTIKELRRVLNVPKQIPTIQPSRVNEYVEEIAPIRLQLEKKQRGTGLTKKQMFKRIMEGGSLSKGDLEGLLKASYNPKITTVGDFVLDKSISSTESKVFVNNKTGQVVVAHRGTKGFTDWFNNATYAVGGETGYKMTARYKRAKAIQDKAEAKYGANKITTIGHSQGGLLAELLGKNTHEIITLNKATRPFASKAGSNQYDIRTEGDIISALNPVKYSTKRDLEIKSNTLNPLKAHSTDSLKGLDKNIIGKENKLLSQPNYIMEGTGTPILEQKASLNDILKFVGQKPMKQSKKGISNQKVSIKEIGKFFGLGLGDMIRDAKMRHGGVMSPMSGGAVYMSGEGVGHPAMWSPAPEFIFHPNAVVNRRNPLHPAEHYGNGLYSGGGNSGYGLYSGGGNSGYGLYSGGDNSGRGMGCGCECCEDECCRECVGGNLFDSISKLAKKGFRAVKKEAGAVEKEASKVIKAVKDPKTLKEIEKLGIKEASKVIKQLKDPKTIREIEKFGIYQVIPTLSAGLGGLAAGTAAAGTAAADAGITAPMIPFAGAAGSQAGSYAGNKLADFIGKQTGIKKGKGLPRKGRFEKGSQEARDFMKSLREKKGMKLV